MATARKSIAADILLRLARPFCGGFILVFHEIPARQFIRFVEALDGFHVVHLTELVKRVRHRKPTRGLFAITVDDGVGENVRALARAMQEKHWPGTFYLPSGYLDSGVAMPFQWLRAVEPFLPKRAISLTSGAIDLSGPGAYEKLWRRMETLWRTRRPDAYLPFIMELVDAAAAERGLPKTALEPPRPIGWEEVRQLSRSDLISFESHGVSHVALSSLTEQELEWELEHSRNRIAENTARPCRHFCYPFGSIESIGPLAPAIARRYYDSAVTMYMGHVDGANPWVLPRIPLYPKNSMLFAGLKLALKCTPMANVVVRRSLPRDLPLPAGPETST
jgi:peptidoglycan/xylan/chitin deacetylase (PgdA/CDA1 family)